MTRAFFARCPSCKRLLILGQTCVCGTNSLWPKGRSASNSKWGSVLFARTTDPAPRTACETCQFEGDHECSG